MTYSRTLGPPLVAASVAMIVIANFCVVLILADAKASSLYLFSAIWPLITATTVVVVLIMSLLYGSLHHTLDLMQTREQAAIELGMYDPLTGLANRILLQDRLKSAIDRRRRIGEHFAVLMLDLDHFKKVNDFMGHNAGDELLISVAKRLKNLTRDTDTVARLGGDEFVIIQSAIASEQDAHLLCRRIIAQLSSPFQINGREVSVGVSIGALLDDQDRTDSAEFIRLADIALYNVKDKGRNGYELFSEAMDSEVQRRANIEEGLRKCLPAGNGLDVHYQPQINVHGQITGLEALLRWEHPTHGAIHPGEFVSIAEEVGLIDDLGMFVFRQACATAAQLSHLSVAVNMSALQFTRGDRLASQLKDIAHAEGVPCERIEIEITENVFLADTLNCGAVINALRENGFRIVLDDFGTGYSSLSYLRQFNVDKIKLDKSFADYANLHNSVALIRAVVTLSHTLGLEVVVEGIESVEQEQVALEAGCDGLQGYRYGKAMPLDQIVNLPAFAKAA